MPNTTATCIQCNRQFVVIEQEQAFLHEKNLPLPTNCPSCRQTRRLSLRGSERALYKAVCSKCQKEIIVAFNPQKTTNQIFCKQDYDQYLLENDNIISDPLPEV